MGSKKFGNSYNVGGENTWATCTASYNAGEYKGSQQEKERSVEHSIHLSKTVCYLKRIEEKTTNSAFYSFGVQQMSE